jgi:MerR family transcriptional regulator/heat shock protein HspR
VTTGSWFSFEDIAVRCEVEIAFLERLASGGLLPECDARRGPPETTLRVRRIVRLQRDLGVNLEGASVIMDLLARIDVLEREIKRRRS